MKKKIDSVLVISYIVPILFAIFCLIPFIYLISGSLSTEKDIVNLGYRLVPKQFTLLSYRIFFLDYERILRAYFITICVTIIGTFASLLVNSMAGYSVSIKSLKFRKYINFYFLFTMLFNGGMVPWYIICVNTLHLRNTFIALILPYLANAFNIILLRSFMQSIHDEIRESAKIDGASDLRIFFSIMLPLSKPALATIGLFTALGYWNDWWLGLMLIDKQNLQPLQILLRTIISNVQFLQNSPNSAEMMRMSAAIPSEGIRMAACVVTIGPIVILYPFLQKYFVKGLMLGSVKG